MIKKHDYAGYWTKSGGNCIVQTSAESAVVFAVELSGCWRAAGSCVDADKPSSSSLL